VGQGLIQFIQRQWLSPLPVQLVRAILVAALFELLVYLTNRRIRAALEPALRRDTGREPSERIRRRRIVEALPLLVNRGLLYVVAFLMIFRIFGLKTGAEVLPILLAVVLVALVIFKDHLRDAARGYYIHYDYLYAPGERVTIGKLTGVVTEVSLRNTQVRTSDGQEMVIPNSQVRSVINHSRQAARGEATAEGGPRSERAE